jgi:hypothetical protein
MSVAFALPTNSAPVPANSAIASFLMKFLLVRSKCCPLAQTLPLDFVPRFSSWRDAGCELHAQRNGTVRAVIREGPVFPRAVPKEHPARRASRAIADTGFAETLWR